ncbi:pentapeptide repeat-containing protein [Synechocystis sp. PCC 7338]|uniref:pentapeptide repeat-containing protein n=1 Tax=Synechocystis sp. PCC 7338 TaxID=2732530 RepID=UPI001BAFFDAA
MGHCTAVIMQEFSHYYEILGLEVGASLEEINEAYRDLAFVWHPDRLPRDNPRLLAKAAGKLKEINQARDRLKEMLELELSAKASQVPEKNQPSKAPKAKPKSKPRAKAPPPHGDRQSRPHHQQPTSHNHSSNSHHHQENHNRPYYRDLTGADLRWANLKEKDLSGRKMVSANLSNADLSDSFLHQVNLENANLFRANLFRANLLEANLRGANLQEANLVGADLSGADLSGANLQGAKIGAGNRIMVKLTATKLTGAILPDGSKHS